MKCKSVEKMVSKCLVFIINFGLVMYLGGTGVLVYLGGYICKYILTENLLGLDEKTSVSLLCVICIVESSCDGLTELIVDPIVSYVIPKFVNLLFECYNALASLVMKSLEGSKLSNCHELYNSLPSFKKLYQESGSEDNNMEMVCVMEKGLAWSWFGALYLLFSFLVLMGVSLYVVSVLTDLEHFLLGDFALIYLTGVNSKYCLIYFTYSWMFIISYSTAMLNMFATLMTLKEFTIPLRFKLSTMRK